MESYILATGILIDYISFTSFRLRMRGAVGGVSLAGIDSIVNFIIDSDFKLLLLTFIFPWAGLHYFFLSFTNARVVVDDL